MLHQQPAATCPSLSRGLSSLSHLASAQKPLASSQQPASRDRRCQNSFWQQSSSKVMVGFHTPPSSFLGASLVTLVTEAS